MISVSIKNKLIDYFKKDEFNNLLEQLTKKYINYGSCVGTITLKIETDEESLKLSKFLSKNFKVNDKVKIKVSDIQKSLDDSVFEGVSVNDLVLLFNPKIKTNKELKRETSNYIEEKINEYMSLYRDSVIYDLFGNDEYLKKIKYLITHDNELLSNIFKSLVNLPIFNDKYEQLAIFSSQITGNPHYYDLDSHNSNTFIQFICYVLDVKFENKRSFKKEILSNVGILIDEVSNYVITYNLYGNELLDVFKNNLTPLNINLANIRKFDKVKAVNNKLLIVENPSFLGRVIDMKINYSVIVTSGNSNSVIYKLLDKMKDTDIYFNGDFDPEGLLIAQNFKDKYPNIKFIGYNEDYFYNGISENKVNSLRLKKLDKIKDKDLVNIKNMIITSQLASYQEKNYDMLLLDIIKINR